MKIVECVPNFSEGRDKSVIEAISGAIKAVDGVKLLNVDPGTDFNRTVYTFVGEPESVLEAAFQAAKVGISLIDMRKHKGEHARMGALDVVPFTPIKGVTMDDCVKLSKRFGERMAKELGVPVFLYADSAIKPERVSLPDIRKGEYETLEKKFNEPSFKPDYGEPKFIPKSGATATGAREILIAYNVNLNTSDKSIASKIAGKIRTSGVIKKDKHGEKIIGPDGKPECIPGRFKGVQAGGMMYNENVAQVSMNLLNYHNVNLCDVFEATKEEAGKLGVKVTGSELVGLVPEEALVLAGKFYSEKEGSKISDEEELVGIAIDKLGLSNLYLFNPDEKVIEYMVEEAGPLASLSVKSFLSELASSSPAPGGGSVAALSGALGAALVSMVCHLTIGKKGYENVSDEMNEILKKSKGLKENLMLLIDEDTNAFNKVMAAYKMSKETDEDKQKRRNAIQDALKNAANVPLDVMKQGINVLTLAKIVSEKGNKNAVSDAGVAALMSLAGMNSAMLNIEINLSGIKDEKFVSEMKNEVETLTVNGKRMKDEIIKTVKNKI
ncbi:MAG: glutamate formimidoyltransferase [Candidatus Thermoplasmatota archaeon]|nr:glutamate formimidoyltransferase [Candidatus Thermoplasmatota archaeon]